MSWKKLYIFQPKKLYFLTNSLNYFSLCTNKTVWKWVLEFFTKIEIFFFLKYLTKSIKESIMYLFFIFSFNPWLSLKFVCTSQGQCHRKAFIVRIRLSLKAKNVLRPIIFCRFLRATTLYLLWNIMDVLKGMLISRRECQA